MEGVSIFPRKGIKKCSKFCRLIYDLEGGKSRCQAAYKRAGKQAALFGEPYIFRCPSGLVEWAAPIILNGQHVGTIICGQVLMWEPEEFFWIELRKMNQPITDDFEELFAAVFLISEEEMFRQLQKNPHKAKAYLEEQISRLRFEAHQNLALMQAKMTELLILLFRVLVRLGVDTCNFTDINQETIPQLYQSASIDQISVLTAKAVDSYLERLDTMLKEPDNPSIELMLSYIEQHYGDNLSVEQIAAAAQLSVGYAGRIFRKSQGRPIMDHVTSVRVEKSKELLLNPHYQIQAIAENVGYEDASYFTKVFKKSEGITPTQFRKMYKR